MMDTKTRDLLISASKKIAIVATGLDVAAKLAPNPRRKNSLIKTICELQANSREAIAQMNEAICAPAARMSDAVLTLSQCRGKSACKLAMEYGAVVTEAEDDGASQLFQFPDGSRIRISLSANIVDRAADF
jgi:hypothetical protein